MDGLQVGTECYRSVSDAAIAACSSWTGTTSAGVVSCQAPTISGSTLTYTLKTDTSEGTTSRTVTTTLQPCEPLDWDYYAPVIGAWFLALVMILCAKSLYQQIFRPEGTA